jgi:hypothetical protein
MVSCPTARSNPGKKLRNKQSTRQRGPNGVPATILLEDLPKGGRKGSALTVSSRRAKRMHGLAQVSERKFRAEKVRTEQAAKLRRKEAARQKAAAAASE